MKYMRVKALMVVRTHHAGVCGGATGKGQSYIYIYTPS